MLKELKNVLFQLGLEIHDVPGLPSVETDVSEFIWLMDPTRLENKRLFKRKFNE